MDEINAYIRIRGYYTMKNVDASTLRNVL